VPESEKFSVLYVDDEPGLLEIGKIFLEVSNDFSVGTTESAVEALRILGSGSFDAIVADYQMPGMDGIAFLKQVRATYGDIPFILFTGRGREDVVIDAINNGADFYLQKGGDPEAQFAELTHKLRHAIQRKQADLALKKSERDYRNLIESAGEGIYIVQDFLLRMVNPATSALTGYTEGELLGQPIMKFVHPDDSALIHERFRRRIAGEDIPTRYSYRLLQKDGATRWVGLYVVAIVWNGRPATLNFITDIHEHKLAEDALKESEERFRLAMDASTDGIWDWDIATDQGYFSPGYYRMLGYPPGAFPSTGNTWEGFIHLDDRDYVLAKNRDCIENRCETFEIEYRIRAADGSWKWILGRGKAVSRDASGRALRMIGTHVDLTERKRTEEELRESEEKYRLLIENSHDIIYTLSPDGVFRYVSPSWTSLLGHPVSDVIGRSFTQFVHPDDIPRCMQFLKKTINEGCPQPYIEYRVRHADGSWRWNSSKSVPLRDKNGTVTGYEGIASNITERKNAEKALRESEEKYRLLIENGHDIIYTLSPEGKILYISPSWPSLIGHPVAGVIGKSFRQFIHPEDLPVCEQAIRKTLEEGILQPYFEYRIRHADGSWRWHSSKSVPLRDDHGKVTGYEGIASDITERKDAENALRESEEKYRHILENLQDAYFQTDNDGKIILANPSTARLYGFGSAGEMIGYPAASLYLTPQKRMNTIQKLKDGGIRDYTGTARRKDGSFVPVSLNIQFRTDKDGRILGTEAIVRDITSRMMMEHSIKEANRKLNLLSSITRHDIVNQVSILRGYAKIALAREQDEKIKEFLSRIDDVGTKIGHQIAFTKAYQELGVHSPCWQRVDSIMPEIAPKEIRFSCPCREIEIYADPMLEKVFFNLLDNSLRHGGHVTQIALSCEKNGKCLTIQWEDNGVGIPAQEKEKIFERGFGKNTGYGLFLTKEILAITGMTIRETGEPGAGARFIIEVPDGHWREGAGTVPEGS